jgi:hemerythrin-like domain-containing protein
MPFLQEVQLMGDQTKLAITRRHFLCQGSALTAVAVLLGPAQLRAAENKAAAEVDVTPTEDLMREHGVLRRLLLIYDDMEERLDGGKDFPLAALSGAIDLMRRFIEDYHEKDEEDFIFPRFEKAGKLVDLVKVLYAQHQAGRKVTAQLQGLATPATLKQPTERQKLIKYLEAFIHMYRPHAAWEDTVLYPAFRSVITPQEFDALGDQFEDKEQKLFGKDGYEKIVTEVAGLEKQLGLYDLSQFTPKV